MHRHALLIKHLIQNLAVTVELSSHLFDFIIKQGLRHIATVLATAHDIYAAYNTPTFVLD